MFGVDDAVIGAGISAASSLGGKVLDSMSKNNHSGSGYDVRSRVHAAVMAGKKYGISPLTILGSPAMAGSGVNVGDSGGSWSDTLGNMGQDISRAVLANRDRAAQALALEHDKLSNDLLRLQAARLQKELLTKPAVPQVLADPNAGKGYGPFLPGTVVGSHIVMPDGSLRLVNPDAGQNYQNAFGDVTGEVPALTNAINSQLAPVGPSSGIPYVYRKRVWQGGRYN